MVPWLWFLTQTARCYLFFPEKEEKSIFEVIEAVIDRAKSDLHVDPLSDLQGIGELNSRKVKHCVQYRETDFNFLSRTMEKYGVFYYFKFEDGKHTLVLDMKKNYPVVRGSGGRLSAASAAPQPTGDHITSWQHDYEFVPGKWSHTDYNFETPSTSLNTSAPKLPSVDVPASGQVRGLRLPRWLRRQIGWRGRRADPPGRERGAAQPRSMGPARAAPSRRATSSR